EPAPRAPTSRGGEKDAGWRHGDAEERRHDRGARGGVAVPDHLEDECAGERLAARPFFVGEGLAPDAVSAGDRLQLLQVESHELDARQALPGDEEPRALE